MSSIIECLYKSFSFVNSSTIFRSSHRTCSAILKNFVMFAGKQFCWCLFFLKVAGLQASNCIKKGLQQIHYLSGEYREIYKNIYFEELEEATRG